MAILIRRGVGISGGAVSSFATWNPADTSANISLDGTNLIATMIGDGSVKSSARSTGHIGTRKVYFEMKPTTINNATFSRHGFGTSGIALTGILIGEDAGGNSFGWRGSDGVTVIGNSVVLTLPTFGVNDVVQFAINGANGHMWGAVNGGTWTGNGAGDPATDSNPYDTVAFGMTLGDWYAMLSFSSLTTGNVTAANFGQSYAFPGSKPSGYVDL